MPTLLMSELSQWGKGLGLSAASAYCGDRGACLRNHFRPIDPRYGPSIAFRGRFKSLVLPLPDGLTFKIAGQDTFIAWCIVGAGAGGVALINQQLLAYRKMRRR